MGRARRSAKPPAAATGAAGGEGPGPSPRATSVALLMGVLALLAVRVAAAVLPGRAAWGLDLWRDLPAVEWLLPLAAILALCVPAVGRFTERLLPAGGFGALTVALAGAVLLVAFVIAHPDRTLYTGDTGLRHGEFARLDHPEQMAPQATRGDLLLHHALPRAVEAVTPWSTEDVGRAQGAVLALLTALAGWQLAAVSGARGLVALAVAAIASCTGALALENGYAKASVEVCALTTILAWGLVRLATDGRGLGTVGVSLALALLLHRSALALVPAWLAGSAVAWRAGRGREPGTLLGLAAPLAALAISGPALLRVVTGYDRAQHLSGFSALLARLTPAAFADAGNALALLVPGVLLLPVVLALRPRPGPRAAFLAASLVLPPLALLVAVPPRQGLPRDWDVFAFAGSAIAAVLAWRIGVLLAAVPRARWLAAAIALAAVVPSFQWAALQSQPERMWSRAEAILVGPPYRDREERAQGLATIGLSRYSRGEFAEAQRLFQLSLAISPNPRTLVQWGILAGLSGHPDEAMDYYRRATAIRPDLAGAWQGIAEVGMTLSDVASVRAAVAKLEVLEPGNPALPLARRWLGLAP